MRRSVWAAVALPIVLISSLVSPAVATTVEDPTPSVTETVEPTPVVVEAPTVEVAPTPTPVVEPTPELVVETPAPEAPAPETTEAPAVESDPMVEELEVEELQDPSALAAPMRADEVSVGTTKWSTQVAWDGTGHGTDAKCAINSANGFADPVDDGPNDGVVCSDDTFAYEVFWNVSASPTPTVVTFAFPIPNSAFGTPTTSTFCSSDPAGSYTAKLTSSFVCEFTFAANQSASGSFVIPYFAGATDFRTDGFTTAPKFTATLSGSTPTPIPADTISIASTILVDSYLALQNTVPAIVEVNGEYFLEYVYEVKAGMDSWPYSMKTSYFGRLLSGIIDQDIAVELTGFPTGTTFTPSNLTETSTGVFSGTVKTPVRPGAPSTTTGTVVSTITARVPATSIPQTGTSTFVGQITQYDVSLAAPITISHPDNVGGVMTDPGLGLPISSPTLGIFSGTSNGQTTPNNNWSSVVYDPVPSGKVMSKTVLYDVNGVPGSRIPTDQYLSMGGQDSWALLSANAYLYTSNGGYMVCDAFRPVSGSSTFQGGQLLDLTRDPIINYGGTPYTGSYKIEYANFTNNGDFYTACSTPNSTTGWFTDPTKVPGGIPSAVRVIFDGPVSMVGNGTKSYEVYLPFTTLPASGYPMAPASTGIYNYASATFDRTSNQWPAYLRAVYYVQGPSMIRASSISLQNSVGSPVTSIGAGTEGQINFSSYYSPKKFNDGTTFDSEDTYKISSCAIDLTYPSTYKLVSSPDLGPDGIACTSDDVSGWVFTYSVEDVATANDKYEYIRPGKIGFSVPLWAPTGSTVLAEINGTTVASSGESSSSLSTRTLTVTTQQVVGQHKTADTPRVMLTEDIGWRQVLFNNTAAAHTNAEFIDILPYVGDGRGTTGDLSDVRITAEGLPTGGKLFVTTVDPSTLVNDVTHASNTPTNSAIWQEYDGSTGDWTAIYLYMPSFPADSRVVLHTVADTDGNEDLDVFINNLGTAYTDQLGGSIPPTQNVVTEVFVASLSGTLWGDDDKDKGIDSTELTRYGNIPIEIKDSTGKVITVYTEEDGTYMVEGLILGTYTITPLIAGTVLESPTELTTEPTLTATLTAENPDVTGQDFGYFTPTPAWSITKTSDPVTGTMVGVGSEITYTLNVSNNGDVILSGTTVVDDMSDVLDNATLVSVLPPGAVMEGTTLKWTVPSILPSTSAQLVYTVRVNSDAWGETLLNSVHGTGGVPPTSCTVEEPCKTTHETPVVPVAPRLPALGGESTELFTSLATVIGGIALTLLWVKRREQEDCLV